MYLEFPSLTSSYCRSFELITNNNQLWWTFHLWNIYCHRNIAIGILADCNLATDHISTSLDFHKVYKHVRVEGEVRVLENVCNWSFYEILKMLHNDQFPTFPETALVEFSSINLSLSWMITDFWHLICYLVYSMQLTGYMHASKLLNQNLIRLARFIRNGQGNNHTYSLDKPVSYSQMINLFIMVYQNW